MPHEHEYFTIRIPSLMGIPDEHEELLFDAMGNSEWPWKRLRPCGNEDRLLVCLYFMSELSPESHHLDTIEGNLRKIFPRSATGLRPEQYESFQADAIRMIFNMETRNVRLKRMSPTSRLFERISRGYWRNTSLGNGLALRVLDRRYIRVDRQSSVR
jgi:hypothetical protein